MDCFLGGPVLFYSFIYARLANGIKGLFVRDFACFRAHLSNIGTLLWVHDVLC